MANEILRILRLLIESGGERLSIRRISLLRKVNYKTAYNAVMQLSEEGIVRLERLGNTTNCYFAQRFNPLVLAAEYGRRDELLRDKDIKVLQGKLDVLPFPFVALVFGSYAKGGAKRGSDIDLLAVCEKERVGELESAVSLLPLKIHLTAVTPEEFIKMARSREFSVVSEAMRGNVVLVGVEDYYRLVQHVG